MNRGRRWVRWAAASGIAAAALTGCVDNADPAPTAETPSGSPEESALAEDALLSHAVDTAVEFVGLTDQAFSSLEVPAALYDVTTDEIAANIAADVSTYIERGYHLEGTSQLLNATHSRIEFTSGDSGLVSLTACLDTSGSQVVDSQGQAVPGEGTVRRPVTFEVRWQNESGTVTGTAFPDTDDAGSCAS